MPASFIRRTYSPGTGSWWIVDKRNNRSRGPGILVQWERQRFAEEEDDLQRLWPEQELASDQVPAADEWRIYSGAGRLVHVSTRLFGRCVSIWSGWFGLPDPNASRAYEHLCSATPRLECGGFETEAEEVEERREY